MNPPTFTLKTFPYAALSVFLASSALATDPIILTPSTTPNAEQQAQIDRRYGMFVHFGINTFADQEWTDGTLPATLYAPTAIDAEQWVAAAYAAGMKHVILTCKHHDGFCLWDSAHTTYDVASSGNATDVVKACADACKKYGIGFGIYYSLWDRNKNGNVGDTSLDAAYNQYMLDQLTELMTNYGDVVELWLDGGWAKANTRWNIAEIYDLVKTLQPHCQVSSNWTIGQFGNPDFHAVRPSQYQEGQPIRYFPSDFRLGDPDLPVFPDVKLFSNNGNTYYLPFESTITLTGKWFFHTADVGNHRSVESLTWDYFRATAQDNILIYNSPPNRDGVLRLADITLLKDIAARIGLQAGQPFAPDYSRGATASASAVYQNASNYDANKAIDENPDTRWASPSGHTTGFLEVDLGQIRVFDRVFINEYVESGVGRIQNFTIDYWDGSAWHIAHTGTAIGELSSQSFVAVEGSKVRLSFSGATDGPSIYQFRTEFSNKAYTDWRTVNFPGQLDALVSSDTTDGDADFIPNIIEYLIGFDPNTKNTLPKATTISHGGSQWARWSVPLNPQDRSGILQLQYSYDLSTWKDAITEADGSATSTKTSNNWTVEVKLNPELRCFFRLKANNVTTSL